MNDAVDSLKAAAHEYRSRGWRVIQLHRMAALNTCSCMKGAKCGRSAGKHPRDLEWQNTPAPSAADIETIWDRWDWNIGIATGEPSGLWVLDIDPDGGGLEAMAALVAEHGALPETFVVQTGSGGYHYYFLLPDFELRNSQGRVGKGIDTRATGGQVVAPPSVSGKGVYTVLVDAPLAQAPEWLLELARKTEVDPGERVTATDLPKPEDIAPEEWERCNRYAKSVVDLELTRLDNLAKTGWDGEPWNATTYQVSCSLLEIANSPWNAYTTEHARSAVMEHAPRDADFDDYVVTRTFDSAVSKVEDGARPYPVDRRAEPDPMFDNPDVRPYRPTGGEGEPTGPVVGREVSEYDFYEGKEFLAAKLANAVGAVAPVGWGVDRDFWSYDNGVWTPDGDVVKNRMIGFLGDKYRRGLLSTVEDIVAKHALKLNADPDPKRMNFLNGMLDWEAGDDLLDHDPEYGSTVQLPIAWDPAATCPRFDEFLADVMHQDYQDLAWEMLGYLMMSGNPHHVSFMFYGTGGNGKSTLMDVIGMMLGKRNIASESLNDLSNNRFRTANLFGKIANLAGDIDATYQENTATFKRLTGQDEITGERKNRDPFMFVNWAVPCFSANKFPGSADVTDGYLRRWIVLHFHKKIPANRTIDRAVLMNLFEAELPGIAAKAIRALRILEARGNFDPQGEATKGKEEFAEAIDQVRQWVASGTPLASPEGRSMLMDLYASYVHWTERSGRRKVTEQEFSHRLEANGYPLEIIAGSQYHKGLMVNPTVSTTMVARTVATMFDDA